MANRKQRFQGQVFWTHLCVNRLGNSNTESYTYDADGNKLTYTDARDETTDYTYDALDRLTSVEDPNGHTTGYTYDADGNQTSVPDPDGDTTGFAYDADDRLVTLTPWPPEGGKIREHQAH